MKVAFILNSSWNIYNFRKGLVQHFLDRGDEVVAIAPKDDYSHLLEEMGCKFVPLDMEGTGMNPIRDFGLIFSIRKRLKSEQPDVVLSYTIKPNMYGSIACGSLGIPCICNVSGLGTVFLWKGILRRLAVNMYRFAFRFNKWVFFQNNEDRDEFLSFVNINPQKTSLVPGSGINTSQFGVAPSGNKDKTVFLMVSRLIVEKGVREYIEAIKHIKPDRKKLEFRLIGGLDEGHARAISRDELDEWIEDDLITYKQHSDHIADEMKQADVIVLPSYREGTPRTLLEGGASGKILLATDVPGCRHVVRSGVNGFLFEVRNPKDLAAKITLLMSMSSQEQEEMSRNSRKIIEEVFDESHVVKSYSDKIDELLSEN
ncbi:MAG: glycosyltransferase family 4 protein [Cyclobacteriaceae bacterium]